MAFPVASFVQPAVGSREWNAVARVVDLQPTVRFIGRYKDEHYYRIQAKDRPFHCATTYKDMHGIRQVRCDCEAHTVFSIPCFHAAAAVMEESKPRKRRKRRRVKLPVRQKLDTKNGEA